MSLICSLLPGAVTDGETALAPHLLPSQEKRMECDEIPLKGIP